MTGEDPLAPEVGGCASTRPPRRDGSRSSGSRITPADPLDPAVADLHSVIPRPDEVMLQKLDPEIRGSDASGSGPGCVQFASPRVRRFVP
jgi:hypothetical protein